MEAIIIKNVIRDPRTQLHSVPRSVSQPTVREAVVADRESRAAKSACQRWETGITTCRSYRWDVLLNEIIQTLRHLGEDESRFTVIGSRTRSRYVQFASKSIGRLRGEAVSNFHLAAMDELTPATCRQMTQLGWRLPRKGGNFQCSWPAHVPVHWMAALAVRTLRDAFQLRSPSDLEIKREVFGGDDLQERRPGKILYTIGYEKLTRKRLKDIMTGLSVTKLIDCRTTPSRRAKSFSRAALAADFKDLYLWKGDILGAHQNGLNREGIKWLSNFITDERQSPMLIGKAEAPGACHRHFKIAMPLFRHNGIDARHICDNEVVRASELQRAIDDNDEYEYESLFPSGLQINTAQLNGDLAGHAAVEKTAIICIDK